MFSLMNQRLDIEARTDVERTRHGMTYKWTKIKTIWGSVEQASARTQLLYQQLGKSGAEYRIIVRDEHPLLYEDHRIIWNGKALELMDPGMKKGIYIIYTARRFDEAAE